MDANELRRAFTGFFAERGHTLVASSGLIPHHPTAPLFTNAGMNQFVSYFLGEEAPPYPRATSVQKCVRAGGKHNDIDQIGRTTRHLTFFEMLGNFSFGDYFKELAIPYAWELVTGVLRARSRAAVGHGLRDRRRGGEDLASRPRRSPPTASSAWARTTSGRWATPVPAARARRSSGTRARCTARTAVRSSAPRSASSRSGTWCSCRTCGAPTGASRRWPGRTSTPAPGLERTLAVLNGLDSIFDTDVLRPGRSPAAESVTGRTYGNDERERRQPADPGRPRPDRRVPRQRRRAPEQRGPRLRAAPPAPPRRAPRVPARRRAGDAPRADRPRGRGDGRGLPGPAPQRRLPERRRDAARRSGSATR